MDSGNSPNKPPETVSELEGSYEVLQASLSQVRQAVSVAIDTANFLEQQLEKSKDNVAAWASRAASAFKQGNSELFRQAREREQQYADVAKELEAQLQELREGTIALRRNLAEVEESVQNAYIQKQVLEVREHAANAQIRANDLIAAFDTRNVMEQLKHAEKRVVELESRAAANIEQPKIGLDPNLLLVQTTAALERATKIIALLEEQLSPDTHSQQPEK